MIGRLRWLLSGALLLIWAAVPASAHSQLLSSDPADGAALSIAPPAVTLTFSEDLLAGATTMAIVGADGSVLLSSPVDPQGPVISLPWPAELPPGAYEVSYRVVSGDGHPVAGAISFSYQAQRSGLPAGSLPPPMTGPKPSLGAVPGAQAADMTEATSSPFLALAGIAAGVVAIAAVIGVLLRRRRQP